MLSQKALDEFKQIYLDESKVALSDQEAQEKAEKLLLLMKTIYRQIPKNEYENEYEDSK
ncbi:MAG TPA: hypothetical protein VNW29_08000 [Candidatus Sulfotelmatobacter sp.]|jgi:hypothetical protein|nr:hypothetical protein [Candidatus Sulfotelmatobacter sp.]